ncbi:hypothetical protein [Sphingobacterium griseoflavum]|uniref:Uncharacterized protein n=1 Tax=Sphingobacterium griseoflavum TaxID=1474952 RepID=A0ABQ3HTC2_9SPHI|nr:hypothetical protein [Sphingobacterium griseoflavum]GHE23701.1 hypothetical protein GCM10017764_06690 [Sphingobacterium griseoflavum]
MQKLLITYGTRPFAQRLGRMLSTRFSCHYASSEPFPELLLKGDYRKIPTGANPTFAHELLKLSLDEGYSYVLPLGKMELQVLHETRMLFEEYGVAVLLPDQLTTRLLVENPPSAVEVRIIHQGFDLLGEGRIADPSFSGVAMLSDEEDEPLLCLA